MQPIACAEPVLRFGETLVIEDKIKDVLKKLEQRQLGCGTPDAAKLLARLLRSWAVDIHASTTLSRNAISSQHHHSPHEQETAILAEVDAADPMEVVIDVDDGKLQDGGGKVCGPAPTRLSWTPSLQYRDFGD